MDMWQIFLALGGVPWLLFVTIGFCQMQWSKEFKEFSIVLAIITFGISGALTALMLIVLAMR